MCVLVYYLSIDYYEKLPLTSNLDYYEKLPLTSNPTRALLPTPLEPYNKDRMKQPHLKPEFKMKRKQPYLKPLYKQPNPKLVYKRKTETKRSRLPLYKFKRAEDHHIQCRHDRCAPLLPPFSPVISASQEQQIPPDDPQPS